MEAKVSANEAVASLDEEIAGLFPNVTFSSKNNRHSLKD
jgi:hypothetical protein